MEAVFLRLLNMSLSACWLILAVVLLRLVLKRAPMWSRCVMWALVGVRLVFPYTLESALSLIPSAETVPMNIIYTQLEVQTGVPVIDGIVNPALPGHLAPSPTDSVNPMQVVLAVAVCLWLVGVAAMLVYMAVSFLRIRRKVGEAVPMQGNVYLCDRVESPFILGIFRARIYLPSTIKEGDIPHVLSHERAHLKRRDHWWKPIGFLVLAVHWFNPLAWAAYVLLCRDIELACDEKVIRDMGEGEKKPYSDALINCAARRRTVAACPLAFGEVGVKGRIKSVLNYKKPVFWVVWIAVAVCIVLSVCFLTDPVRPEAELEQFLQEQIALHNDGQNKNESIFCADYDIFGMDRTRDEIVVYMCVYAQNYDLVTGEETSGWHVPTVITVDRSGGEYKLAEYWEAKDGSYYPTSIREKYPFYLWFRAMDTQSCLEEHRENCEKQRQEQLAMRGEYEQYCYYDSPDPMAPNLALKKEGNQFRFSWSVYSSYYCRGTYELTEDTLTLRTDDGQYTFIFYVMDSGFQFDESRSSPIPKYRYSSGAKAQSPVPDGAVFEQANRMPDALISPEIDTAVADMDGDGIEEKWSISYGPSSGLYTVAIRMAENGQQQYFGVFMPVNMVESFERDTDGTLWIRGKSAGHGPSPRIDIRIEDDNIVLFEYGEKVPCWAEWRLESQDNGTIYSTPIENTNVYTYNTSSALVAPSDAALILAEQYLRDLMQPSQKRTFQITKFKDLKVELYSAREITAETAKIYALQPSEIDEHTWIAEIDVKFQYEGTISPIGSAENQWVDGLYQASPIGFLLTQNGAEYTLQSRYRTATGKT